ncbi:MAG: GNAT family N-acetyltransferase [Streptosporangiaceae bacterium]
MYEAAFGERPGFPGWTRERWISWISDDEDFRPEWTLLASLGGTDAAFVAGAAGGWVAQLGVVPGARGRDIGAALMAEVVRRMRAAGETTIRLNVNVNNPHAAALYRRLGFARTGGRARYRQSSMTQASG